MCGLPLAVSAVVEFESMTSAPPMEMVGDPLRDTLPLRVGLRATMEVPTDAVLVTVTGSPAPRVIETLTGTAPRTK